MTIRHTVDTLTSDALDALYDRVERAEDTLFRAREAARWIRRNYPGLRLANETLTAALDGKQPAPAPAATQTTDDRRLTFDHRLSKEEVEEIRARWLERHGTPGTCNHEPFEEQQ
ncbi:hypothetical protein [Streptomyces sp. NPDC058812]|uniref:hypothetical protein n=1 Tax=unclassified Streptomyces TaxID=2593676 RepID=UPI003695511E